MTNKQYEDDVRTNFKRMETAEIMERLKSDALTEVARHIAVDEIELRTNAAVKLVNVLPQSVDDASPVNASAKFLSEPKYAVMLALGSILILALFLGLLGNKPGLEDAVASGLAQGLSLIAIILIVLFTNSGLNWYRKKKGKPLRSLGQDAGTMVLGVSLIVILVSGVFIVFG